MRSYDFYNIRLDSELLLPELPDGADLSSPPVHIRLGKVARPNDDIAGGHYKPDSVAHRDFYFLEVDDIARYYLQGKDSITIERLGKATEKDVVAFLFDTVLTVLLLKHNKFVFHASAVAGPYGAVMLCGHSGIGKSSIALSLVDKGYSFLEDDRCLLYWDEKKQKVYIRNHLPIIDIWSNESKKIEKMEGVEIIHPVRDNISKLRIDISSYVDKQMMPLDKVITLSSHNELKAPEIKIIKGMAKCSWGKSFTHMEHLIPDISDALVHFRSIMNMLGQVPMIKVSKSRVDNPAEMADFLIDEILNKEVDQVLEIQEAE